MDPALDLKANRTLAPKKVLQSLKFPDELDAIAEKIAADARLAEQEMGLSTLFLAVGFLEWYESDSSDKKFHAPLLLLPVQIEMQKVRGKPVYSLAARDGTVEVNLSLQKLVKNETGRDLPEFEPSDDATDPIEKYLNDVRLAVEGLKKVGHSPLVGSRPFFIWSPGNVFRFGSSELGRSHSARLDPLASTRGRDFR